MTIFLHTSSNRGVLIFTIRFRRIYWNFSNVNRGNNLKSQNYTPRQVWILFETVPFVKMKIRFRYENSNDPAELIHSTSMLVNENWIKNNEHSIVHVRMCGSTWSEDTMERQVYAYSNVYRGMSGGARNPNVTYLVSYSQSGNTTELL